MTTLLESPSLPAWPAVLELLAELPPQDQDEGLRRCPFLIVQANQELARLLDDADPAAITAGPLVHWDSDGRTLRADCPGRLCWQDDRLWIETTLKIAGHVDYSTGNITFPGDVQVARNVVDLFELNSGGSITVGGLIEAARVVAASDISVHGGIAGKDKACCQAGGLLQAKYIANAQVSAGSDIQVQTEISHSRVVCRGQLRLEQGSILASHVVANGGVVCHTLGATSQVKTLVEVGVDDGLRRQATEKIARVEASKLKAQKVRQTVEPLLRQQKNLSAQQKEQATELLYEAAETETNATQLLEQLKKACRESRDASCAELLVNSVLYPGVTIRFPNFETTIATTLRGPVKILVKSLHGHNQIVASDLRGRSVYPLEFREVNDPASQILRRLLGPASS